MAYEKTAIADTTAAIPTQPLPQMREEREIDPYRSTSATRLAKASQAVADGQSNINRDKATSSEQVVSPPEEVKGTEETLQLSPQVAALARKEQAFRQKELDIKKRADALEADRAEIAELKALKTRLANKDYSGVEDLIPYDDYTKYFIEKESNLSPEQLAVKKLADEVEAMKTAQKQDVEKRFEAAVNERRNAVKSLVETNADYSAIKELKAEEVVVQHILQTWENDQKELTPEEAAKEVEAELLERANKWNSLSKLKAKSEPVADEAVDPKKQLPPLKAPIKTLTNNMAATGEIKRPVKSFQFMSDAERYAEARRRAEEKLKLQNPR